jgi:branched-chain amino acid transport system substrate-binding protein
MIGQALVDAVGDDLIGSFGTAPGGDNDGAGMFLKIAKGKVAGDGKGPFDGNSYDAAALIVLAMQAAGSADRAAIQAKIMSVANAPGVKINPGELAKGLKILADGGEIDYVGATAVEFNDVGEVFGSYKELEVEKGKFATVKIH